MNVSLTLLFSAKNGNFRDTTDNTDAQKQTETSDSDSKYIPAHSSVDCDHDGDKNVYKNKMSFFFDFCFTVFLLWLVIFVALLFYLDGDLSLMFHAKFGKKIRKKTHNTLTYLEATLNLCLIYLKLLVHVL